MRNQSMKINPCESIHEKLIHGNQSMKIQSMDLSMGEMDVSMGEMDVSMGDTKKTLSGLLSNIFVFFDFLDEFFHEDQ
jgi:hypothetical protein